MNDIRLEIEGAEGNTLITLSDQSGYQKTIELVVMRLKIVNVYLMYETQIQLPVGST